MKKLNLALTLLTLSPRLATAQEAPTATLAERVTPSRAVPKALGAWVPRGGKSRFWGATNLQWEGKPVWVHVYDVDKNLYAAKWMNYKSMQKSALDLFVLCKSHQLQRISTTRFDYKRNINDKGIPNPETIGIEILWLRPKERRQPIVKISLNDPSGYYGTLTQEVLVVFPQSLKNAVVQTEFSQGVSNVGGDRISFGVDEKGSLNILADYMMLGTGTYRTAYKWENNYFRPFENSVNAGTGKFEPIPLTPP